METSAIILRGLAVTGFTDSEEESLPPAPTADCAAKLRRFVP